MKDKFRVRFAFTGWEIQHSRTGIFWRSVGGYEYMVKSHAQAIVEELNNGTACADWFKAKKKEAQQANQPDKKTPTE